MKNYARYDTEIGGRMSDSFKRSVSSAHTSSIKVKGVNAFIPQYQQISSHRRDGGRVFDQERYTWTWYINGEENPVVCHMVDVALVVGEGCESNKEIEIDFERFKKIWQQSETPQLTLPQEYLSRLDKDYRRYFQGDVNYAWLHYSLTLENQHETSQRHIWCAWQLGLISQEEYEKYSLKTLYTRIPQPKEEIAWQNNKHQHEGWCLKTGQFLGQVKMFVNGSTIFTKRPFGENLYEIPRTTGGISSDGKVWGLSDEFAASVDISPSVMSDNGSCGIKCPYGKGWDMSQRSWR